MRLGYINYLNCYPYYHSLFEEEPLEDVQIVPAYPSELNRMMMKAELDMSPISAAAYTDMEDDVVLLPDFCLSSVGYVHSVILTSLLPIEDLHGKKVGLSRASQTSVVLLKILLKRYYAIEPYYVATEPNPVLKEGELDAALVIGNEAMQQGVVPYTYDLGDLWLRRTGFPVVFAVFAIRRGVLEQYQASIEAVCASYHKGLRALQTQRAEVIRKACARYPHINYDVDAYYRTLQYTFSPALREALRFYFDKAGDLGLLRQVGPIRFYHE